MRKVAAVILVLWSMLVCAAFAPLYVPAINIVSNSSTATAIQRPVISQFENFPTTRAAYSYFGKALTLVDLQVSSPMPIAGTIDNLYIWFDTDPGGGAKSYTFVLNKNGSNTALTCTVSGSATTCNDITNSVTVAAGDLIEWRATAAAVPTPPAYFTIASRFTATGAESVIGSSTSVNTSPTARWLTPDQNIDTTTSYAISAAPMPTAGTLDRLYMSNAANANTLTVTLYKNGSATALTCAGSTSCSDVSNSVSFSAGDTLSVRMVNSSSTAQSPNYTMRWTPTTAPEVPLFYAYDVGGLGGTPADGGFQTGRFTGALGTIVYSMPVAATFKKLYSVVSAAPGAAKSRTVTTYKNTSVQSLTCVISGATTTTCNDTTNSFTANVGDSMEYVSTPAGAPTTAYQSNSVVVTVP